MLTKVHLDPVLWVLRLEAKDVRWSIGAGPASKLVNKAESTAAKRSPIHIVIKLVAALAGIPS